MEVDPATIMTDMSTAVPDVPELDLTAVDAKLPKVIGDTPEIGGDAGSMAEVAPTLAPGQAENFANETIASTVPKTSDGELFDLEDTVQCVAKKLEGDEEMKNLMEDVFTKFQETDGGINTDEADLLTKLKDYDYESGLELTDLEAELISDAIGAKKYVVFENGLSAESAVDWLAQKTCNISNYTWVIIGLSVGLLFAIIAIWRTCKRANSGIAGLVRN